MANEPQIPEAFPTWDATVLAALADYGTERALVPGDELFHAGQPSSSVYVVLEGEIEVIRPDVDRDESVGLLGTGQVLGDVSLLRGQRPALTARATRPGRVLDIGVDDFRRLRPAAAPTSPWWWWWAAATRRGRPRCSSPARAAGCRSSSGARRSRRPCRATSSGASTTIRPSTCRAAPRCAASQARATWPRWSSNAEPRASAAPSAATGCSASSAPNPPPTGCRAPSPSTTPASCSPTARCPTPRRGPRLRRPRAPALRDLGPRRVRRRRRAPRVAQAGGRDRGRGIERGAGGLRPPRSRVTRGAALTRTAAPDAAARASRPGRAGRGGRARRPGSAGSASVRKTVLSATAFGQKRNTMAQPGGVPDRPDTPGHDGTGAPHPGSLGAAPACLRSPVASGSGSADGAGWRHPASACKDRRP